MRIAIVSPILDSNQMALWRETSTLGVELHLVGSTEAFGYQPWMGRSLPDWTHPHVIKANRRLGHAKFARWTFPELSSVLSSIKPDIVHVLMEPWGFGVGQALRTGIRTVAHGAENEWRRGGAVAATLRLVQARRIVPRLSGYASWNTAGVRSAQEFGLGKSCPTLVAPAVLPEPELFRKARSEREQTRVRYGLDGLVVGFVGRLAPEKGVKWLLKSFARADTQGARLAIVGSGQLDEELRSEAAALGVDAHFLGAVAPTEVPGLMAAFDLLVVPSVTYEQAAEQFGRVAVEAMLAGTPVVASRCGELGHVVGGGGIIVPERDEDALSRELHRLIVSSSERAKWSERGLSWSLQRYVPQVVAKQVVTFWEEVRALPALT